MRDADGAVVVRAMLGRAAAPAYATFETAGGKWRIEHAVRSNITGTESASVMDRSGRSVAIVRVGELILAGGETLPWKLTSMLRPRCRIGEDLWVAKVRGRKFTAELSEPMLARPDVTLLTGIASILTRRAGLELGAKWSGAAGAASWG